MFRADMLTWRCARFDDLSAREVHDIFQARISVFVLEQDCAFQDADGVDPLCWHLAGYELGPRLRGGEAAPEYRRIAAYARLVPPGAKYSEPSIGRVLTTAGARGTGVGHELMRESLAWMEKLWPGRAIRIGAQEYLRDFYGEFGFSQSSEPYDEDGIIHIEMLRPASKVTTDPAIGP